ncbi:conserved hypothetical protein [Uncinocarpus reesii 1704]|uniref:SPRY domain-containing protein n=1 Tax=Uncinocarpus reesii (strain UAMH 1704) TaxID=336963 RepID=C4JZH0_UNCRE|nr:uncharacterized protein UREG_07571 [Uncinocarpus reesii 1704]EEP82706.1 conserved hypothetical protein [Uncinocarpus reesii 1704]
MLFLCCNRTKAKQGDDATSQFDTKPEVFPHSSPDKTAQPLSTKLAATMDAPSTPIHNWEDIPDNTDLPPPPAHAYLYSNTGNASEEDAERAHDFCDNTPLVQPRAPSPAVYQAVQEGNHHPTKAAEYSGSLFSKNGRWRGETPSGNRDCIVWTNAPMYFAKNDSPLVTERRKTIYFEVKLMGLTGGTPTQTPGFSIGYIAQPYPTWRSPGWERGSLGVFSDDGCRFVNDSFGGKEFTTEFQIGETVGLGMTFYRVGETPPQTAPRPPNIDGTMDSFAVKVFFTRDGKVAGSWDLHEEIDEDQGSIHGLEGDFDLHGAIGFFGGVEFQACFDPSGWLWSPSDI